MKKMIVGMANSNPKQLREEVDAFFEGVNFPVAVTVKNLVTRHLALTDCGVNLLECAGMAGDSKTVNAQNLQGLRQLVANAGSIAELNNYSEIISLSREEEVTPDIAAQPVANADPAILKRKFAAKEGVK